MTIIELISLVKIVYKVVATSIGFLVFFVGISTEASSGTTPKYTVNEEADKYIEECIKETTLDGVFFISLQGGYFDVPEPYIGKDFLRIPIYGKTGKYSVPDINTYQKQLGLLIEKNINRCLKKPDNKTIGENISITSTSYPDVKISKAGYIDVSLTLNVSNNDKNENKIEKTKTRVDSEYYKYCEMASKFIEMQKQDPNVIMFSDIVIFAENNNITITYFESPENFRKIIYVLEDKNYERKHIRSYNYLFALEYEW